MSKAEAGKGSTPRPFSVTIETYDNNYEMIFGRKVLKATPQDEQQHQEFINEEESNDSKSFSPIHNSSKCSMGDCGR